MLQNRLVWYIEHDQNWIHANRVEAETEYSHSFTKTRMNNTQVNQVSATKSLGVIIDDKLDWHSHIEKLTKKIASMTETNE